MKKRQAIGAGFTLIELLVVIAIIAILAAILFTVFSQAREKSRQVTFLSNQKQIGLDFQQYGQDYDELFPPADYNTPTPAGIVRVNWKNLFEPNYMHGRRRHFGGENHTFVVQSASRILAAKPQWGLLAIA